jgi:hypothetical protein
MASWSSRAATVSDALEALLKAAVGTAVEDGNAATRLSEHTARFDNVVSSLEQDLIALAEAQRPAPQPVPHHLLRSLAEHEAKRSRTSI